MAHGCFQITSVLALFLHSPCKIISPSGTILRSASFCSPSLVDKQQAVQVISYMLMMENKKPN